MKFENISDLRILIETERGGSLTAAAKQLDITPAAASAMLKRLELQAGVRLFERSTRSLRLTAEGATLHSYAERALELLEEGASQALSEAGALRGGIRIAAPSDISRAMLLGMFDRFMELHPAVQIFLSISDKLQDVRRDAIDLALRYGQLQDSELVARPLVRTRRVACAAPAYLARHGIPAHPSELKQHQCITLFINGQRETRWQFEAQRRNGTEKSLLEVPVSGSRCVDDGALAHAWALAGGGIVYKSGLDVAQSLQSGALQALFPDWHGQAYQLHAVLPGRRFIPARVRALCDFLEQQFGAADTV